MQSSDARVGTGAGGRSCTFSDCSASQGCRRSRTRGMCRKARTCGCVRASRLRSSETPTPHLSGGGIAVAAAADGSAAALLAGARRCRDDSAGSAGGAAAASGGCCCCGAGGVSPRLAPQLLLLPAAWGPGRPTLRSLPRLMRLQLPPPLPLSLSLLLFMPPPLPLLAPPSTRARQASSAGLRPSVCRSKMTAALSLATCARNSTRLLRLLQSR